MGGYYGGRKGWRRKVEAQHAIDIRRIKQKGVLYDGFTGTLIWRNRGEETGRVDIRVSSKSITLNYRCRKPGEEWEPMNVKIALECTPCNYGGKRTWMLCPYCQRRCAVLYLADKTPACRKCYDLAYYSEGETRLDRIMRKARKAQEKIGYDKGNLDELILKPKGMHWKTYERQLEVIEEANEFFESYCIRRFNLRF